MSMAKNMHTVRGMSTQSRTSLSRIRSFAAMAVSRPPVVCALAPYCSHKHFLLSELPGKRDCSCCHVSPTGTSHLCASSSSQRRHGLLAECMWRSPAVSGQRAVVCLHAARASQLWCRLIQLAAVWQTLQSACLWRWKAAARLVSPFLMSRLAGCLACPAAGLVSRLL